MTRPLPLTILAWVTIVTGVFTLSSAFSPNDPETRELMGMSIRLQIAFSIFGGVVLPAAGIGLLRGIAWARELLVLYMIITLIAAIYARGDLIMLTAIPTAVMYVAALAILYGPATSSYLNGTYDPDSAYLKALRAYRRGQGAASDLMRVLAVIVLIGCAILLCGVVMLDAFMATLPGRGIIFIMSLMFVSMGTAIGILMWGRRRWKVALGWVLATGGGYAAMVIIVMRQYVTSDLFSALMDDIGDLPAMGGGGLAVLIALVGVALVVMQKRLDRETVLALPIQHPPSAERDSAIKGEGTRDGVPSITNQPTSH